jgi:D-alanyl-D-alanine carboxypeptidase/D-alanyl-D-alanine-endopeptidase (penicillin-binding protein 4)
VGPSRVLPALFAVVTLAIIPLVSPPASSDLTAAGTGLIAEQLDRLLQNRPLSTARTSVLVLDALSGETLFSRNPDAALKPASNMKLVTAAAGLALLRPEYKFRTVFYAAKPPDPEGVIKGDFFIKGGGSPGLVGEQWWMIARRLRALGVKKIEGDLVGDDSFFDDVRRGRNWPSPRVDNPYNAPVSALSCFYSAVSVTVRPTAAGRPPEVFLEPFESFFKVVNRAVTQGRGRRIKVERKWEGGRNIILVTGRIGQYADPTTTYKSVEQPTLYTLAAFREAAGKEGIVITGADRRGLVPAGAHVVHTHLSRSLSKLVVDMNKNSNNFMAESILKTIGAELGGPPGSSEKGATAVMDYLRELGLNTERLIIADGSGLSHDNRLSARSLAALLLASYKDFHSSPEFIASLPVGGIDGTLDRRLKETSSARNIRAKTGRINGVSTLSGYAWNKKGRMLIFSILVNGIGKEEWAATKLVDRLGAAMVESDLPQMQKTQNPTTGLGGV